MKKLALKLDDLTVESFVTSSNQRRPGTVNAHSDTGGFTDLASCVVCTPTAQVTECGGDLCGGGGSGPMKTCDDTTTMNDLVSQCVTASLAGPTCEGEYGETCGYMCG